MSAVRQLLIVLSYTIMVIGGLTAISMFAYKVYNSSPDHGLNNLLIEAISAGLLMIFSFAAGGALRLLVSIDQRLEALSRGKD
jgi:hypothetical protein